MAPQFYLPVYFKDSLQMHKTQILSYFTIALFLLLASCNSEKQEAVITNETLNIPIDAKIAPRSNALKCVNFKGADLLYYLNYVSYELIIFDLESKTIKHRLKFEKEGPDGIDYLLGFTVLSEQEIAIADRYPKLHIVNLSGETIKRINYQIDDGSIYFSREAPIGSSRFNDIYKIGNSFIIPQEPPFRNGEGAIFEKQEKLKGKIFLQVNEDGTNIQFLDITLPDDYYQKTSANLPIGMSSFFWNNRLFWTFSKNQDIYYTDDFVQVTKKEISVGRQSQDAIDPISLGPFEALAQIDSYGSILHDPYRKQIYRMVRYGVNGAEKDGLPSEHLARYPNKFSIFVFDESLNFKREVKFAGTKYHFNQFFISSKGFYLSIANPLNPDFDENFLQFEKIEL